MFSPSFTHIRKLAPELLSWKSNLALLQQGSPSCPCTLETVILLGVSDLHFFCRTRLRTTNGGEGSWVVKDALANGAGAIWMVSENTWRIVVGQM
jgi:hypothetical protein